MTYTIPLQELRKDDIPSAGGKGANLGELAQANIPVPPGFVITTQAYNDFVAANCCVDCGFDTAVNVRAAHNTGQVFCRPVSTVTVSQCH